jgi:hypothetical protein
MKYTCFHRKFRTVLHLCIVVLATFGMAVLHGNFPESHGLKSVRQILLLKTSLTSYNLVAILVYSKFLYDAGTYKPAWLVWLG